MQWRLEPEREKKNWNAREKPEPISQSYSDDFLIKMCVIKCSTHNPGNSNFWTNHRVLTIYAPFDWQVHTITYFWNMNINPRLLSPLSEIENWLYEQFIFTISI
jgi:hypothetical protein